MNFWKKVLWIGVPVAVQNLINTLLNMIDTFMISNLGQDFVSAVGLANKVFFVFNLLMFGIISGASILTSQYFGSQDENGLNKSLGFSLILCTFGGVLFFVLTLTIPSQILSLFTKDSNLIKIGSKYLQTVSLSYLTTAISMCVTGFLKSINKTRAPMLVTFSCLFINLFFNYMFIFGKFGAPRLEVQGAAIGTVIARVVEITLLVIIVIFCKKSFKLSVRNMTSFNRSFLMKIIKISYPVIINEFMWGLGTTIYSVIYGHISSEVVAAMTISATFQDLAWVFLIGISNACAILVGNMLGASLFDEAEKAAANLLKAAVIFAAVLGITIYLTVDFYSALYTEITDLVRVYIKEVCLIYAIVLPFKAFNSTNICGILRSGGDIMVCILLDVLGVWMIAIPGGLLAAFVFKLPIMWVYAFISLEEPIKMIFGYLRYKKKIWVRNVVAPELKISE